MGNLSSCTSSSRFNSIAPSSPPPSLPPVARVLLLEGGELTFTLPIKAIKLLLDYPFYIICPVDSFRPGQHSLSSLLPDEELELGRHYLLLPLTAFENRQSMPDLLPSIWSNMLHAPMEKLAESTIPNLLSRNYCNNPLTTEANPLAAVSQSAESSRLGPSAERSDVSFVDVGDSNSERFGGNLDLIARCEDDQRLIRERLLAEDCRNNMQVDASSSGKSQNSFDSKARENQKFKKLTSMATFNYVTAARCRERVKLNDNDNDDHSQEVDNNSENRNEFCRRRLCDTPELQMAYRSAMLRRCRSWTPRLQSITENKRLKSVTFD